MHAKSRYWKGGFFLVLVFILKDNDNRTQNYTYISKTANDRPHHRHNL